ncbi:chaperone protein ClpB3, chloroplastic [Artemisia annua]|uniref:Chaperone protein ClpB3, chloroplastic n=1 Tax=Artemisia annua TaxID=35608 RepID=A0A2U1KIQ5_ARTAN|nr:chaperone protein ClpB3, chloroplastic [Artemisia annua]
MSSLEVAMENKHQIRETKHWLKAILEQKNGQARRIFSMDNVGMIMGLNDTDSTRFKWENKVLHIQKGLWLIKHAFSGLN